MNSYTASTNHLDQQRKDEIGISQSVFVGAQPNSRLGQDRAGCVIGSPLTETDYAALAARWIDRDLADLAQLRRVDSITGGEVIGRKNGNNAGILIPYFHPDSDQIREFRLRRDQPDLEYMIPPAISRRGRNTSARRVVPICFT